MVVEEGATAVTKFGFVRVITEGLKVWCVGLTHGFDEGLFIE